MTTGLVKAIKQAAIDAVDNAQMCDLRYGTVVSVKPLKIQITNQFVLPSSLLIVPEHLTDYEVEVTVNWNTKTNGSHSHSFSDSNGDSGTTNGNGEHTHEIVGKKTMTIHNALKVGDKVALLRKQGGQSYFILDRI